MESQYDSVDISQLKAIALNSSPYYQTSPNEDIASNARRDSVRPAGSHPAPLQGRKSVPEDGSQQPQRRLAPGDRAKLPSTIPDSTGNRMNAAGLQSQGDTQPASPWVYEKYHLSAEAKEADKSVANGDDVLGENSGHIDLMAAYDHLREVHGGATGNGHHGVEGEDAQEDDGMDLVAGSQDVRAELFPESLRFRQPKTPLSQGVKRKRGGFEHPVQAETPKLPANPFANVQKSHERVRLSQLFDATQAVTSPHVVASDGLSERPSPHFNQAQRPSTADSLFSPARAHRLIVSRAATEPQAVYISMKESQEARERLRTLEDARNRLSNDSSDDDFEYISDRPLKGVDTLASKTPQTRGESPSLSSNRLSSRTIAEENRIAHRTSKTPKRPGKTASDALIVSDDPLLDGADGNASEEETERESEYEGRTAEDENDELADDNKENLDVPMTISRPQQRNSQISSSQPTPSRYARPVASKALPGAAAMVLRNHTSQNRRQSEYTENEISSPYGAIYDSQSSQRRPRRIQHSSPNIESAPPSSLESRNIVLQSQLSQQSKSPKIISLPTARRNSNPAASERKTVQRLSRSALRPDHDKSSEDELTGSIGQQSAKVVSGAAELGAFRGDKQTRLDGVPNGDVRDSQGQTPEALDTNKSLVSETTSVALQLAKGSQKTHEGVSHTIDSKWSNNIADIPSQSKQSTTTMPFDTARENLTPSSRKSQPQIPTQSSSQHTTPAKASRRQMLGDIANDLSPPKSSDEFDADLNILNNDDIEFQAAVYGTRPEPLLISRKHVQRSRSFKPVDELRSTPDNRPSQWSPITTPPASFDKDPTSSPMTSLSESFSDEVEEPPGMLNAKARLTKKDDVQQRTNDGGSRPKRLLMQDISALTTTEGRLGAIDGDSSDKSVPAVLAPNRVFAHFNGKMSAFYSATCLALIPGPEPRYSVRFDDGVVDTVSAYGVKRLELRPGDMIRIDAAGARGKNFVVVRMKEQQGGKQSLHIAKTSGKSPDPRYPEVDVHGFTTAVVVRKTQGSCEDLSTVAEQQDVPLSKIYFTQTMWSSLKDRDYVHVNVKSRPSTDGLMTPSEHPSTPSTPLSRTRRLKSSTSSLQSRSIQQPRKPGIFRSMMFSLTNIASQSDLDRTKSMIEAHGGSILEEGFEELFHMPTMKRVGSSREVSPGVSSKRRESHTEVTVEDEESDPTSFHLLPQFEKSAGFTCLIADKHCRRAKYIQALALGIPCLATRWISDCVTRCAVVAWHPYLLPAGESAFLGHGAVRSRVLPFNVESVPNSSTSNAMNDSNTKIPLPTLKDMVATRPRLLSNKAVLLLTRKSAPTSTGGSMTQAPRSGGGGLSDEDTTMKPYILLISAMGPKCLLKTSSLEFAVRAAEESSSTEKGNTVRGEGYAAEEGTSSAKGWDWLVTASATSEKDVRNALDQADDLQPNHRRDSHVNRNRLNPSSSTTPAVHADIPGTTSGAGITRIVNSEVIVQSLIAGMLVD